VLNDLLTAPGIRKEWGTNFKLKQVRDKTGHVLLYDLPSSTALIMRLTVA
jgi:hypothetical protein